MSEAGILKKPGKAFNVVSVFATMHISTKHGEQAWASRGPDSINGGEASQTWSSSMLSQSQVINLMV